MPSELGFPWYPQVTETTQDGFTRLRSWVRVPQRPLLFTLFRGSEGEDFSIRVRNVVRPLSVRDRTKGRDGGDWSFRDGPQDKRVNAFGDFFIGFGEEVTVAVEGKAGGRVPGSTRDLERAGSRCNPERMDANP